MQSAKDAAPATTTSPAQTTSPIARSGRAGMAAQLRGTDFASGEALLAPGAEPRPVQRTPVQRTNPDADACETATLGPDGVVESTGACQTVSVGMYFAGLQIPFEAHGLSVAQLPTAHVFSEPVGACSLAAMLQGLMGAYEYGLAPLRAWNQSASIMSRWDQTQAVVRDPDRFLAEILTTDAETGLPEDADVTLEEFGMEVAELFTEALENRPEACLRELTSELEGAEREAMELLDLVFANNRDHPFQAWVSEMLTSADAPTNRVADDASQAIATMRGLISAGDLQGAMIAAGDAVRAVNLFIQAVNLYKEGLESGAGTAIVILDATVSIALAVVSTVAVGGLTRLVPQLGRVGATVIVSATSSMAGTGLRQFLYDQTFDPGQIVSNGVRDALLAGVTSGMAQGLADRLLPYLQAEAASPEVARRLAQYLGHMGVDTLNASIREGLSVSGDGEFSYDTLLRNIAIRAVLRAGTVNANGSDSFELRGGTD